MADRNADAAVDVGDLIPPFSNTVSYMELNQFAGANREWGLSHMDPAHARGYGFDDVVIMGNLKAAYVANALEDWLGEGMWLSKLAVSFRGIDYVGDTLSVSGRVLTVDRGGDDEELKVTCDIWVDNQRGDRASVGKAVAIVRGT